MMTDWVCIRDGVRLGVDIDIDVTVSRTRRKFEQEIKEKIQRRLTRFFNLVDWQFGEDLKDTDIIKTLSDVQEIKDFSITFTTNDPDNGGNLVVAKYFEIIRPDQINLSFTYV